MKKTLTIVLITVLSYTASSQSRQKMSANSGWQYILNDAHDISSTLTPNQYWQKINLPHTWNALDILDDTVGYHQGIGWYKKELNLPQQYSNKHLELFFEGVCNKTTVFINGKIAGEHEGGFTGFKINLDGYVSFDRPNEILVKVDNGKYLQEKIPPFSGDFNLMGGIYRDVWLVATNKIRFSNRFGNDGILFETPAVSAAKASYNIKCFFVDNPSPLNGTIEYRLSYDNKIIKTGNKIITAAGGEMLYLQDVVASPKLWSPESPNLYELSVSFPRG